MSTKKLFLAAISLFLLQSCMSSNWMTDDSTEEGVEFEKIASASALGLNPPPIAIETGTPNKILFAGIPNEIKILIEGGNTEHLIVYADGGIIKPLDTKKGLYSFTQKIGGFTDEIVAEDTVSGAKIVKLVDVVNVPAPEAYIWKTRTPMTDKTVFKAEEIKKQDIVLLTHKTFVPARCSAISFDLIRIAAKDGKRTSCVNKDKRGTFGEEAKKLIGVAEKGDLYIVSNIKSNCTTFPIRDIVYTIQ